MNNKPSTIYKNVLNSLFVVYCLLFITPSIASAKCVTTPNTQATEYCLLAPIPLSPGEGATDKVTPGTFLPGLFKLVIGIAGLLAVVRLMYAGILYMTSDAWDQKSSAKNIIWDALSGLLLAISAWVILNTIDPKLVTFNINIPQITIEQAGQGGGGTVEGGGGKVLPGYKLTEADIAIDTDLRKQLLASDPKVRVNNGPCKNSETKDCTNLVGLPPSAISGVKSFAVSCKEAMKADCNVMITGGAEGGHVTHGPGKSKVDIDDNTTLNKYIETKGTKVEPRVNECSKLGPQYRLNGKMYVNEGNHWHVCY